MEANKLNEQNRERLNLLAEGTLSKMRSIRQYVEEYGTAGQIDQKRVKVFIERADEVCREFENTIGLLREPDVIA